MTDKAKTADKPKTEAIERRSGDVAPTDRGLVEWMLRHFENDGRVDRFDIAPVGKNGHSTGPRIDFATIPDGRELSTEEVVRIANRFILAAQNDATVLAKKPRQYRITSWHLASSSQPLASYPIEARPTLSLTVADDEGDDEELGTFSARDGAGGMHNRALAYIDRTIAAGQWDKNHYSSVFGQVFTLLNDGVKTRDQALIEMLRNAGQQQVESARTQREMLGEMRALFSETMRAAREREMALSMKEERAALVEKEKVKAELWRESFELGKTALHGFINKMTTDEQKQLEAGSSQQVPPAELSALQKLTRDILDSCKRSKIDLALFGEWDGGPPLRQVKPGILTLDQTKILYAVATGQAPAPLLRALLMGEMHGLTMEQITAVQQVPGVPASLLLKVQQLLERVSALPPPPPGDDAPAPSAPASPPATDSPDAV